MQQGKHQQQQQLLLLFQDYALVDAAQVSIDLTVGEGEAPRGLKVYLIGYRSDIKMQNYK